MKNTPSTPLGAAERTKLAQLETVIKSAQKMAIAEAKGNESKQIAKAEKWHPKARMTRKLSALVVRIKSADRKVIGAARDMLTYAKEAGEAIIGAMQYVKHGSQQRFYDEVLKMQPRTVQRYVAIAKGWQHVSNKDGTIVRALFDIAGAADRERRDAKRMLEWNAQQAAAQGQPAQLRAPIIHVQQGTPTAAELQRCEDERFDAGVQVLVEIAVELDTASAIVSRALDGFRAVLTAPEEIDVAAYIDAAVWGVLLDQIIAEASEINRLLPPHDRKCAACPNDKTCPPQHLRDTCPKAMTPPAKNDTNVVSSPPITTRPRRA